MTGELKIPSNSDKNQISGEKPRFGYGEKTRQNGKSPIDWCPPSADFREIIPRVVLGMKRFRVLL
jgi:hypothetical protein